MSSWDVIYRAVADFSDLTAKAAAASAELKALQSQADKSNQSLAKGAQVSSAANAADTEAIKARAKAMQDAIQIGDRYNRQVSFGGANSESENISNINREAAARALLNRQAQRGFITPQQDYSFRQQEMAQRTLYNRVNQQGYATPQQYLQYLDQERKAMQSRADALKANNAAIQQGTDIGAAHVSQMSGVSKSAQDLGNQAASVQAYSDALNTIPDNVVTKADFDDSTATGEATAYERLVRNLKQTVVSKAVFDDAGALGEVTAYDRLVKNLQQTVTSKAAFDDTTATGEATAYDRLIKNLQQTVTSRAAFDDAGASGEVVAYDRLVKNLQQTVTSRAAFDDAGALGEAAAYDRTVKSLQQNVTATAQFDDAGAVSEATAYDRLVKNLSQTVVAKAELDDSTLDGDLASDKAKLADLGQQKATPKAELDPGDFTAKVADLKAKLRDLSAQTADPNVKLDSHDFLIQLAAIKAQLEALGRESSTAKLNIQSSDFSKVKAAFADLEAQGARAFDDIDAKSAASGSSVAGKWRTVGASIADVFRSMHAASDAAASDVGGSFDRAVARIKGAFSGLDRGGVGSVFSAIATAAASAAGAVVSALGPMGAAILGVIQILPGLTAGLGAASGVLAAAPGLIFAAGGALGTLYNVLSPLIGAIGAYTKVLGAQSAAQASPIQSAAQLAQQQHAVSDAYYQVSQAAYQAQQSQLQNAHAVADAQFSLKQAVVQSANQQTTAAHGVADAQFAVSQANYQAKQSAIQNAHAVSEAAYGVKQAAYQSAQSQVQNAHAVSEAQFAVGQASFTAKQSQVQNAHAVSEAAYGVRDAQYASAQSQINDAHAVSEAQYSLKQAVFQSGESQIQSAHAVKEAAFGASQAQYAAAQSNIGDAHGVAEAQYSLKQAVFQAGQSQIQSAHAVKDSEFSLKEAQYSSAQSRISDAHGVAEAQFALTQAVFQSNQSQIQSAHALADSQFGLREAQYSSAQQGITDAHNTAEAQFALQQATVQSGQAQIQSAHAVAEAQFTLREADYQNSQQRITDAHAVEEAQYSLQQTQFQTGIQQQQTLMNLTDAEHSYQDSVFSVTQAQYQLNIAWQDAARSMQDLEEKVAYASLDLRGAQLNLLQAQQTYQQTMAQSTSTALARAQAAYQVQVAEKALKDITIQNTRNEQDLGNARKNGKDQTFGVTAAQHALIQAQNAEITAQKSLAITQKTAANEQVQAAHSIKDAVFSLKEALVGRSHDIVTAIHTQADALFALGQAFFAQKESAITSAHGIRDAQFNLVQVIKAQSHDLITAAHSVAEAQFAVGQAYTAQKESAITSAHGVADSQYALTQALKAQGHDRITNAHAIQEAEFSLGQTFIAQRENAITSAHGIADAQFGLGQALRTQSHDQITNAHAIQDAQFAVSQAYIASRESAVTSAHTIKDAQFALAQSIRSQSHDRISEAHAERDAQFVLSQAYVAQKEGVITGAHAQADAAFGLRQAQQAQAEGFITSAHAQGDAGFALAQARAAQGEGFITSAHAQSDAVFALAQAIFQQGQGRITAAHAISDAQFALSQAESAQSEGFITGMHSQKDAAFALQAALAAQKLGIPAIASAQTALNAAMAKLGPAGQEALRLLEPLLKWWIDWKGASEAFFKEALPGFRGLTSLIKPLESLMLAVGKALGTVADHFLLWLEKLANSPAWNVLTQGTVQIVLHLGDAAIKVADAFIRIAKAAEPFTTWLVKGIDNTATKFDNWARAQDKAGSSLHKWLDAAKPALHDLGVVLKGVADFFLIIAGGTPHFNQKGLLTGVTPSPRDNQNLQTFSLLAQTLAKVILPNLATILKTLSEPALANSLVKLVGALSQLLVKIVQSPGFTIAFNAFITGMTDFVNLLSWISKNKGVADTIGAVAGSLAAIAAISWAASGIISMFRLGLKWAKAIRGAISFLTKGKLFGKEAAGLGADITSAGEKVAKGLRDALISGGEKAAGSIREAMTAGGKKAGEEEAAGETAGGKTAGGEEAAGEAAGGKVAGAEEATGEAAGGRVAAGEIGVGEAAGLGGAAKGAGKGGLFSKILGPGIFGTITVALTAAAAGGALLGVVLDKALGKAKLFRQEMQRTAKADPYAHWIPGLQQAIAAGRTAGVGIAHTVGKTFNQIPHAFGKGFEQAGKKIGGVFKTAITDHFNHLVADVRKMPESIEPPYLKAFRKITANYHGTVTKKMLDDLAGLPAKWRKSIETWFKTVDPNWEKNGKTPIFSSWDKIGAHAKEKIKNDMRSPMETFWNHTTHQGTTAWDRVSAHAKKTVQDVSAPMDSLWTRTEKSGVTAFGKISKSARQSMQNDLIKPVDEFFGKLLGNVRQPGGGGSGPTIYPGARHAAGGHVLPTAAAPAAPTTVDNQIIAATAGEFVVRKPAVDALERIYGPQFLPGFINVADKRLTGSAGVSTPYSTPGVGAKTQTLPKDVFGQLTIGKFAGGGYVGGRIPGYAGGGSIGAGFDTAFVQVDRDFQRLVERPITSWLSTGLAHTVRSADWWQGVLAEFRKAVETPVGRWVGVGINALWNNSIPRWFDSVWPTFTKSFRGQLQNFVNNTIEGWWNNSINKWFDSVWPAFTKSFKGQLQNFVNNTIESWWNNSINKWFDSVWPAFTKSFKGQLQNFINNTIEGWWNNSINKWFDSVWSAFVKSFKGALQNFINNTIEGWWNNSINKWFDSVWPTFVKSFKAALQNFINNTVEGWWNNSIGRWFDSVWPTFVKSFKAALQNFINNTIEGWWNASIGRWFDSVWSTFVKQVKSALDNFINNTIEGWWNNSITRWFDSVWQSWQNGFGSKLDNFINHTVEGWWNNSITSWFNSVNHYWIDQVTNNLLSFINHTIEAAWNSSIPAWFNSVNHFWIDQATNPILQFINHTVEGAWNSSIPRWFKGVGASFKNNVSVPMENFFKNSLPPTIEAAFKKSINFTVGKINQVIQAIDKVTGSVGVKISTIPEVHAEGRAVGDFRRTGPGSVGGAGDHDTQPILATPGEYVVRKGARMALDRTYGPDFLNTAINQADRYLGYQSGGGVPSFVQSGRGINFDEGGLVAAGRQQTAVSPYVGRMHYAAGGYVNPVKNIHGLVPERIDMGVDFGGTGNLLALGDSSVNGPQLTGWGGAAPGEFMTFTLSNGPYAGRMYYYSEGINPLVRPGAHVAAGHKVASMHAPIEIGWAGDATHPLSQLPIAGSISGGNLPGGGSNPTRVGLNFDQLIVSLGAPKAPNFNSPPGGLLPKNFPTAPGGGGSGQVTFGKKVVNKLAALGGLPLGALDKLLKKDKGFSLDDLWKHVIVPDEKSWGLIPGAGIVPQIGVAAFDSLKKAYDAKITAAAPQGVPGGPVGPGAMGIAHGLVNEGYHKAAAAGIVGCIAGESAFNPESQNCVPLTYKVVTRRGILPPDKVCVGDRTPVYNPAGDRMEDATVLNVPYHHDAKICRIGNRHWSVICTWDHKWITGDGNLVRADELEAGAKILLGAGWLEPVEFFEDRGREDTFCLTTTTGTWTAYRDEDVAGEEGVEPGEFWTGNSGGFGLIGWTFQTAATPPRPSGNAAKDMKLQVAAIPRWPAGGDNRPEMNKFTDPLKAGIHWSEKFELPAVTLSDWRPSVAQSVFSKLAKGGAVTNPILAASSDKAIRSAMLLGSDLESGWNSTAMKGARAGAFLLPLGGKDKITKAQAENTGWAARHLLPMFTKGVALAGAKSYPQDAELAAAYALEGGHSFYRTKGAAKVNAAWAQVLKILASKTGKAPAPAPPPPVTPINVAKNWNGAVTALKAGITKEEVDAFALRQQLKTHGHKHLASDLYSDQLILDRIYNLMSTGGALDLKKASTSSLTAMQLAAQDQLTKVSKTHGHVIAHAAPVQQKKVIADLTKLITEIKTTETAFKAEEALSAKGGGPKSDWEIQLGFLKDLEAVEAKQYAGILAHGAQKGRVFPAKKKAAPGKHPSGGGGGGTSGGSGGGSGGSGSSATGGSPAQNHALAHKMYPSADWKSWDYVEGREAGWNRFARNPSSGAYGIPQALPPSKMPRAAQASGGSHAGPQIKWMWDYMKARYGGPKGAAEHERSHNWYASGGKVTKGNASRWNAAIDALKQSHAPLVTAENALGTAPASDTPFTNISKAARAVQSTLKNHAIFHEWAPEVSKNENNALWGLINRVGLAEAAYDNLATHGATPGPLASGPPATVIPPVDIMSLIPGGGGPDYIPGGGPAPQQFARGGGVGDIASMFSMGGGVDPAGFSAPSARLATMGMYGGGPVPTRQLGAAAQAVGTSSDRPLMGDVTINNPVREKAGESITRATQRLALLAGRGIA